MRLLGFPTYSFLEGGLVRCTVPQFEGRREAAGRCRSGPAEVRSEREQLVFGAPAPEVQFLVFALWAVASGEKRIKKGDQKNPPPQDIDVSCGRSPLWSPEAPGGN